MRHYTANGMCLCCTLISLVLRHHWPNGSLIGDRSAREPRPPPNNPIPPRSATSGPSHTRALSRFTLREDERTDGQTDNGARGLRRVVGTRLHATGRCGRPLSAQCPVLTAGDTRRCCATTRAHAHAHARPVRLPATEPSKRESWITELVDPACLASHRTAPPFHRSVPRAVCRH